ncbi:hypothetical protein HDU98_005577 [Podochytrium sp. JEL0797]|nr:hypothetical protein HDU98_005577 [Podochytrium sp. JEL0797]
MRTIAITPASSRSALAAIESLISGDEGVFLRLPTRRESLAVPVPKNTSVITVVAHCNAANPSSLSAAFEGCTTALIVTPHDPTTGIAHDDKLTNNLIEAAKSQGVEYIVLVGSWTVHHPTELSELAGRFVGPEQFLRDSGLQWTILRGGFFVQNLLYNAANLKAGNPITLTKATYSPIDVSNIGQCAAVCLTEGPAKHHGKVYEMSGPDVLSMEDMILAMGKAVGKEVNVSIVPAVSVPGPSYMKQLAVFAEGVEGCATPFNDDVKQLIGDKEWTRFAGWVERSKSAWA